MRKLLITLTTLLFLVALSLTLLLDTTTNVQVSAQGPVFVTNTPLPRDPLSLEPAAGPEQYALRLWTEADSLDLLDSQLTRLAAGDLTQEIAIRLTFYELNLRFPNWPSNNEDREDLLNLMLQAPQGTVDMRRLARPYVVDLLNSELRQTTLSSDGGTLTVDDFQLQIAPANFDRDATPDAVLTVRYPTNASNGNLKYKDFIFLQGQADGGYVAFPMITDIPAAPYDTIRDVRLVRLDDLNGAVGDEVAISVDRGTANDDLLIYGVRSGQVTDYLLGTERPSFGEIVDWPEGTTSILLAVYERESDRWLCDLVTRQRWEWSSNYFRPAGQIGGFSQRDTVGCAVFAEEPIFSDDPTSSIETIEDILDDDTLIREGENRAQMAIAMLHLLNNDRDATEQQINNLLDAAEGDPWLNTQINAFAIAASEENASALEVCGALLEADPTGACDTDQVLGRIFASNPLSVDGVLRNQLEILRLPVNRIVTLSRPGFLGRQVVDFDLGGASWWEFAPTDASFYIPSPTEAPFPESPASGNPSDSMMLYTEVPETLYAVLLRGDPNAIINLLDAAQRNNPGLPLSPEARYIQALSFDLLANRRQARDLYYSLWQEFGGNPWAQLAGAHLEFRE